MSPATTPAAEPSQPEPIALLDAATLLLQLAASRRPLTAEERAAIVMAVRLILRDAASAVSSAKPPAMDAPITTTLTTEPATTPDGEPIIDLMEALRASLQCVNCGRRRATLKDVREARESGSLDGLCFVAYAPLDADAAKDCERAAQARRDREQS